MSQPLFIVLEIDQPQASRVTELRRACGDPFRASLPAEITLTGSSGVGQLSPGQPVERIASSLESVARTAAPVHTEFGPVLRFPGTRLFVLTVRDEAPFQGLHECCLASDLSFGSNPFPYKPHCTLSSNEVTEEEEAHRLALRLPGPVTLSTLALYGLDRDRVTRMAAFPLKG